MNPPNKNKAKPNPFAKVTPQVKGLIMNGLGDMNEKKFPYISDLRGAKLTKAREFAEDYTRLNIKPLSQKVVPLTQGRLRGGNIDSTILNRAMQVAKEKGIAVNELLGVMSRESTFDPVAYENRFRKAQGLPATKDKSMVDYTNLTSGWNVAEKNAPYDYNRFLADKQVKGITVDKEDTLRRTYMIKDSAAVENHLKKNPKLVDQYRAKVNTMPKMTQDAVQNTADFIKQKGMAGMNPNDKDYTNKINKEKELLSKEKNLQIYLRNKKFAMGGKLRPSSRQRHIAPLMIAQLGVSALGSIFGLGAAAKAQKEQKKELARKEQQALKQQFLEQKNNDDSLFNQTDVYGDDNVEYYANGGELDEDGLTPEQQAILQQNLTQNGGKQPELPVSNGGFQTKGGNLVPIGDGIEEAVGNRHNDTKIDGVSGIQLSKNGEVQAEIEDKEIIADGDTVYSHRLKYDKKHSYADKMRKLTSMRNKLEKKQIESSDKRVKNSVERQLAGLNMAEETLFKHQESRKEKEGTEVLNYLAKGGKIKKLAIGGYARSRSFKDDKPVYKGWKKRLDNTYNNANPQEQIKDSLLSGNENTPTTAELNAKDVDWNQGSKPNSYSFVNPTKDSLEIAEDVRNKMTATKATLPNGGVSSEDFLKSGLDKVVPGSGVSALANMLKNEKSAKVNSALGIAGSIAPMLIDNIGNAILTKNTPKVPTALMNRTETLETRVNVNPQLAELRRTGKSVSDNVMRNTSNSNNAKANLVSAQLGIARQTNELLGGKENQELALRNASAQNRQMVGNANTALKNDNNFKTFQRSNDIQTKLSTNLADLQGDIKDVITGKKIDNQFKTSQLANLMDDTNGDKAILYAGNKEFMADPANRAYIFGVARNKKHLPLLQMLKKQYPDFVE